MRVGHAGVFAALAIVVGCQGGDHQHAAPPATAPARPTPPPPPTAPDPWSHSTVSDPMPHPLLWAAEKDGKTTYFFGTMHIGVDPESRVPQVVWAKLDAAPAFAMETDLSDAGIGDLTRHDGKTLRDDLGAAYWTKLEQAIGKDAAQRCAGMKPMIASTLLSTVGLPETPAMDGVMSGRATNEHKRMIYLEPVAKQVALLDRWTDVRTIKDQLDDLSLDEQHTKDMLAAYIAGDDQKILTLSNGERADFKRHGHSDAEYDEQMEDLIYRRNASWIDELEQLHAAGGGFVAVGALHLIGPRSVLELLAQRGYKVTRLTP